MYITQSVLNHLKNINPIIRIYVLGLIFSHGRKNCAAMADSMGISAKYFYKFLAKAEEHSKEIKCQSMFFFGLKKKLWEKRSINLKLPSLKN